MHALILTVATQDPLVLLLTLHHLSENVNVSGQTELSLHFLSVSWEEASGGGGVCWPG